MRTKIIEQTYYKFSELPKDAQTNVIKRFAEINTEDDWWDYLYEDAKTIGLEIESFDLDYRRLYGRLTHDANESIEEILKNHGKSCETYKLAKQYKIARFTSALLNDDNDIEEEFLKELCKAYLTMLQSEYDYLSSEEAILETITANDQWEFDEEGNLI